MASHEPLHEPDISQHFGKRSGVSQAINENTAVPVTIALTTFKGH